MTRTWTRAVCLATAGVVLSSSLAYGLAPASRFQAMGIGRSASPQDPLTYKQADIHQFYAKGDRGWFALSVLYSSKEEDFLLKAIEAFPKDRPVKLLLVGAGRGRALLDIAKKFPDRAFEFHSINKEPNLLYDLEGIAAWMGEDGRPEEVLRYFRLLHAHHHVLDVSHGRGLEQLDGDFDLVVVGSNVVDYIPGRLDLIQALYGRLKLGGRLFAVIENIRIDPEGLLEGDGTAAMTQDVLYALSREEEADRGRILEEIRRSVGDKAVTVVNAQGFEGMSVTIERTAAEFKLPFRFVRYVTIWDVYETTAVHSAVLEIRSRIRRALELTQDIPYRFLTEDILSLYLPDDRRDSNYSRIQTQFMGKLLDANQLVIEIFDILGRFPRQRQETIFREIRDELFQLKEWAAAYTVLTGSKRWTLPGLFWAWEVDKKDDFTFDQILKAFSVLETHRFASGKFLIHWPEFKSDREKKDYLERIQIAIRSVKHDLWSDLVRAIDSVVQELPGEQINPVDRQKLKGIVCRILLYSRQREARVFYEHELFEYAAALAVAKEVLLNGVPPNAHGRERALEMLEDTVSFMNGDIAARLKSVSVRKAITQAFKGAFNLGEGQPIRTRSRGEGRLIFEGLEDASVLGDERKILSLFRIFFTNADQIEYERHDVRGRTPLEIRARLGPDETNPGRVVLEITDNLGGVSDERLLGGDDPERQNAFLLNTTGRVGGTGLGLAEAWWIVKLHSREAAKSSIRMENVEAGAGHRGARIVIRLPELRTEPSKSGSGDSGNDVDDLIVKADEASVKGDFEEAAKFVKEALALFRDADPKYEGQDMAWIGEQGRALRVVKTLLEKGQKDRELELLLNLLNSKEYSDDHRLLKAALRAYQIFLRMKEESPAYQWILGQISRTPDASLPPSTVWKDLREIVRYILREEEYRKLLAVKDEDVARAAVFIVDFMRDEKPIGVTVDYSDGEVSIHLTVRGERETLRYSLPSGRNKNVPDPMYLERILNALYPYLRPGARILYVGSGAGEAPFILSRFVGPGGRVVGLERSTEDVLEAEAIRAALGLQNVEFVQGDLKNFIAKEPFDVAAMNTPLLPIPADWKEKFEEEALQMNGGGETGRETLDALIARAPEWLREGGVLIFGHLDILALETTEMNLKRAGMGEPRTLDKERILLEGPSTFVGDVGLKDPRKDLEAYRLFLGSLTGQGSPLTECHHSFMVSQKLSAAPAPVDVYGGFYRRIRQTSERLIQITERDLERSRMFLTPEGRLKTFEERRSSGAFGVTEVFFLPESPTRNRMADLQKILKDRFGDKLYLVDADKLHLTSQGLEGEPLAGALKRAQEIQTPAFRMEVGRLNWDPSIGIFWELRPYLRDPSQDPLMERRKAWGLPQPRSPHVTAAYFAKPFSPSDLAELRGILARYEEGDPFGDLDVTELHVIAYEDLSFNSGYRVLERIPLERSSGRLSKGGAGGEIRSHRFPKIIKNKLSRPVFERHLKEAGVRDEEEIRGILEGGLLWTEKTTGQINRRSGEIFHAAAKALSELLEREVTADDLTRVIGIHERVHLRLNKKDVVQMRDDIETLLGEEGFHTLMGSFRRQYGPYGDPLEVVEELMAQAVVEAFLGNPLRVLDESYQPVFVPPLVEDVIFVEAMERFLKPAYEQAEQDLDAAAKSRSPRSYIEANESMEDYRRIMDGFEDVRKRLGREPRKTLERAVDNARRRGQVPPLETMPPLDSKDPAPPVSKEIERGALAPPSRFQRDPIGGGVPLQDALAYRQADVRELKGERAARVTYNPEFARLLPEAVREKIEKVLTTSFSKLKAGQDYSGTSGGRGILIELPKPIQFGGVTVRALKIKGASFDAGKLDEKFDLREVYRDLDLIAMPRPGESTVVPAFDAEGRVLLYPGLLSPKGGLESYSAREEYEIARELSEKLSSPRLRAPVAVAWGSFPGQAPSGVAELGFVVLGIPDPTDQRGNEQFLKTAKQAKEMADIGDTGEVNDARDMLREFIGRYGRALRDFHDAGYIHYQPHLQNFSFLGDETFIYDLGGVWRQAEMTGEEIFGYKLLDLYTALWALLNTQRLPFYQRVLSFNFMDAFLSGYLGRDLFPGYVTLEDWEALRVFLLTQPKNKPANPPLIEMDLKLVKLLKEAEAAEPVLPRLVEIWKEIHGYSGGILLEDNFDGRVGSVELVLKTGEPMAEVTYRMEERGLEEDAPLRVVIINQKAVGRFQRRGLTSLLHLYLIKRFALSQVEYEALTEDGASLMRGLKEKGIFTKFHWEGAGRSASVDQAHAAELISDASKLREFLGAQDSRALLGIDASAAASQKDPGGFKDVLQTVGAHPEALRMIAGILGVQAAREALKENPAGFADLMRQVAQTPEALQRLSHPESLGAEILRAVLLTSPVYLARLLEGVFLHKPIFEDLSRPESIGIEALREAARREPDGFTQALDTFAGEPNAPATLKALSAPDSVGLDVLREAIDRDSIEFVRVVLDITHDRPAFDAMARALGFPAVREAIRKEPRGFAFALRTMGMHQAVFRRLAQPVSLGVELLRDVLAGDPGEFGNLIDAAANTPDAFGKLCEPGTVGVEAVRAAIRGSPEGLTAALASIGHDRRFFETFERLSQPGLIGQAHLQEAFRKDPKGLAYAIRLINHSPREGYFFRGFERLVRAPISRERLAGAFVQLPYPFAYAAVWIGRLGERTALPIREDGAIDLDRVLNESRVRLVFDNFEVASLNATRGLVELLGLPRERVVIGYQGDVTESLAGERFPGYGLTGDFSPEPEKLFVRFSDETEPRLEADELVVPYDPYKCALPERVPDSQRRRLREAMRLPEGRKVVVLASPGVKEMETVLQAYEGLEPGRRPLLILGLRQPNAALKGDLIRRGLRAVSREVPDEDLSAFGQADAVVLNTAGELLNLLGAADLAIVGHDRNIFEPASQGVPILYFGGDWSNNTTAKYLLDKTGGAVAVDPSKLADQMVQILDDPGAMIEGTRRAVEAFHREVVPAAKLVGSIITAAGVLSEERFYESLERKLGQPPAAPAEPEALSGEIAQAA